MTDSHISENTSVCENGLTIVIWGYLYFIFVYAL